MKKSTHNCIKQIIKVAMLHEEAFVQSFISAAVSQKNIADFIKGGCGYCSNCGGPALELLKNLIEK